MKNYQIQYGAGIAVAVIGGMLGAAAASSEALELTRQQVALIGVVTAGLTILASFLPRINRPPDPARTGLD